MQATFTVKELRTYVDQGCAPHNWNQGRGFLVLPDPRRVRFRFCIDGSVEIEFHEAIEGITGGLPVPRKIASVSSVREGLQLADVFFGQQGDLDTLPGTHAREFIRGVSQLEEIIESWRASTGAEVEVVRKIGWEDHPTESEEIITIRSASRHVLFGEPKGWRDYPVFVNVSEGSIQMMGYLALREDAEQLLDHFLRQHCPLNQAEKLFRQAGPPYPTVEKPGVFRRMWNSMGGK